MENDDYGIPLGLGRGVDYERGRKGRAVPSRKQQAVEVVYCTFCGRAFDRKTGKRRKRASKYFFCSAKCNDRFRAGSLRQFYISAREMTVARRRLLVDIPLAGYNTYLGLDVNLEDFLDVLADLAATIDNTYDVENFIFCAYYIATRKRTETHITLAEAERSFARTKKSRINQYLIAASKISGKHDENISEINKRLISSKLSGLVRENVFTEDVAKRVDEYVKKYATFLLGFKNPWITTCVPYVVSYVLGEKIFQSRYASAVDITIVSLRHESRAIVRYLISKGILHGWHSKDGINFYGPVVGTDTASQEVEPCGPE